MKKKLFIILISFLLVIVLTALGIIINGHYFKSGEDIANLSNGAWMNYIDDDTLLIDIAMPGSHDSGTDTMNWLGRTQGYAVGEQLLMGARYFDIRVNKTDEGLVIFHSIINGRSFDSVLSDIIEFMEENPSEVLILDFQHFDGGAESEVLAIIEKEFVSRNLAVKNETEKSDLEFISSLRLGDSRGKCVILFGDAGIADSHDFLFRRNNDECTKTEQVLNSCYISEYNKMSSKKFIETALPYYYENIENKIKSEGFKGLFVLQCQLTDGYLVFGPYSKEKTHDDNIEEYIEDIKDDEKCLALTNIVMRDFLTSEKCEDIIALNYYKGNVKEEYINVFPNFED